MRRDLFSQPRATREPTKAEGAAKRAPNAAAGSHRCAVCGGFAPYGKGLPHRGERVVYFCREHKDHGR